MLSFNPECLRLLTCVGGGNSPVPYGTGRHRGNPRFPLGMIWAISPPSFYYGRTKRFDVHSQIAEAKSIKKEVQYECISPYGNRADGPHRTCV